MMGSKEVVDVAKEKLKKEIIQSRKSIRQKYNVIRRNRYETERLMESGFKTILEPLKEIKKELKEEQMKQEQSTPDVSRIANTSEEEITPQRWPGRRTKSFNLNAYEIARPEFGGDEEGEVFESGTRHVEESFAEPLDIQDVSLMLNTTEEGARYMEQLAPLPKKYIQKIISETDTIDYTSGIRFDSNQNKWMLGTFSVAFEENDLVLGENRFKGTEGLYNLIILKQPRIGTYDQSDLATYKKILVLTGAHREGYGWGRRIVRTGIKYNTIIKLIFPPRHHTTGHGLLREVRPNSSVEYTYWNSINKLIERLRLLYASKLAGNTSLNNEIVSIISELKEANIIE